MNTFIRSINAEFFKLKNTPTTWLILLGGVTISGLITLKFMTDPYHDVGLNNSPWENFYQFSLNLNSLFLMTLFVIVLVNVVTSLEEKSNAWKQLYTLPFSKGHIYFSKLATILLLLIITLLIYVLSVYLTGQFLDLMVPEFEFSYYSPDWGDILKKISHVFISLLGIIGIQYWLQMQHRHFLIPIGIGILGFILALILVISNNTFGTYFPYTYVMHINVSDIQRDIEFNPTSFGGLGKLEWFSIAFFIVFSILGYIQERSRNVK